MIDDKMTLEMELADIHAGIDKQTSFANGMERYEPKKPTKHCHLFDTPPIPWLKFVTN